MNGKTAERFEAIKVALSFSGDERQAFKLAEKILAFVHQMNEAPKPESKLITATNTAKNIKLTPGKRGRKRKGKSFAGYTAGEFWHSSILIDAIKLRKNGESISSIANKIGRSYGETYRVIRSYDDKYPILMTRLVGSEIYTNPKANKD